MAIPSTAQVRQRFLSWSLPFPTAFVIDAVLLSPEQEDARSLEADPVHPHRVEAFNPPQCCTKAKERENSPLLPILACLTAFSPPCVKFWPGRPTSMFDALRSALHKPPADRRKQPDVGFPKPLQCARSLDLPAVQLRQPGIC